MGLLSALAKNVWYLRNEDTIPKQIIQGQFPAEDLIEDTSNNYAVHNSLNRQRPILQFLNGNVDTVSFRATLLNTNAFIGDVEKDLETLKKWKTRDEKLGRPPILSFWVGDGKVKNTSCVISSLSGITYDKVTRLGALRRIVLTVNLMKYEPYSLESNLLGETRYHRAAKRDYYEMLTFYEYGSPIMGDIIRKRHPTKQNIQVGDVIKLPSKYTLRKEIIEPKSIVLQNVNTKKTSPQRTVYLETLESRNRNYVSHVIKE